jgi:hypothetical protein
MRGQDTAHAVHQYCRRGSTMGISLWLFSLIPPALTRIFTLRSVPLVASCIEIPLWCTDTTPALIRLLLAASCRPISAPMRVVAGITTAWAGRALTSPALKIAILPG